MLEDIKERYNEDKFLIADGFDEAIIGLESNSMRLIYSVSKCIKILVDEGMEYDEAHEHFYYNVHSCFMGSKTPIWCEDDYV